MTKAPTPPFVPDVLFLTPCLSNHLCVEFFRSAIETDRLLMAHGIKSAWIQLGGDPYLSKARNKLMTAFLDDYPGCPKLFFIDDDIGWSADKAVEFILSDADVISGVYSQKSETLNFPVIFAGDPATGETIRHDRFLLAQEVPTGFMCINRRVIEALADDSQMFRELIRGEVREFYEICVMGTNALNANRWWVGEDNDLSRRIVAKGFNIWVDPKVELTHRGGKVWKDTLGLHLDQFGPAKGEILREALPSMAGLGTE